MRLDLNAGMETQLQCQAVCSVPAAVQLTFCLWIADGTSNLGLQPPAAIIAAAALPAVDGSCNPGLLQVLLMDLSGPDLLPLSRPSPLGSISATGGAAAVVDFAADWSCSAISLYWCCCTAAVHVTAAAASSLS